MCLAQGQNAMMPVRLKPTIRRSRDKHSTTEPLRQTQSNTEPGIEPVIGNFYIFSIDEDRHVQCDYMASNSKYIC